MMHKHLVLQRNNVLSQMAEGKKGLIRTIVKQQNPDKANSARAARPYGSTQCPTCPYLLPDILNQNITVK